MKKIWILMIALLGATTVKAEDNEKIVNSKIKEVTVFIQGAQIYRSAYTQIPKGVSVIVFDDLANGINQQSMQASGKGNFTILDVQYRYHYPQPEPISNELPTKILREIAKLQDSLVDVRLIREEIQERKDAINRERNLLLNHKLMQGQGKVDSLELLKGSIEYLEMRLKDIAKRYHAVKKEEIKMTETVTRMNTRLRDLQNYNSNRPQPPRNAPKHQALVTVVADAATAGTIELNYNVYNAGWSPMYDIKAKNAASPVELTYKAAIYQNTGKDWNSVKLTVSNSNPNRSNTKPYLPVWYVNYYTQTRPIAEKRKALKFEEVQSAAPEYSNVDIADEEEKLSLTKDKAPAKMVADFTQQMQNFTSVEFVIDLPYTIKSDGKHHYAALTQNTLTTEYKHYLVPKLDAHAYVVARVTDWENLNLLIGPANVYFGNTYVGRTTLNPTILSDTLELTLGRDESIFVKRTKLKDDTKDKFIGSKKIYTGSFEIELRNNGIADLDLVIEDQIPLTQNEDIEINLDKKDGGDLNKSTGVITWNLKMKGKDKKKINFTFSIKYNKDKKLQGL